MLHYNANDSSVFLSQKSNEHNNEQTNLVKVVKTGLNKETKKAIQKIWISGVQVPKEIRATA